jgi:hypothetical protein
MDNSDLSALLDGGRLLDWVMQLPSLSRTSSKCKRVVTVAAHICPEITGAHASAVHLYAAV